MCACVRRQVGRWGGVCVCVLGGGGAGGGTPEHTADRQRTQKDALDDWPSAVSSAGRMQLRPHRCARKSAKRTIRAGRVGSFLSVRIAPQTRTRRHAKAPPRLIKLKHGCVLRSV
jgi:hypothetical protein